MSTSGKKYMLYHYEPSEAAAIAFVAAFAATTVMHMGQLAWKRTWYFTPFVVGGIFETIGFIGRALNARQAYGEWTTPPYVMQSLLLLLAPALFAASIYMVLGRIIVLVDGEAHSPIRVKWLTKVFVAGDVISFLTQSAGGGMLSQAKTQSKVDLGEHVITAGLGIQVLFFGLFIVVAAIFHMRIRAMPSLRSQQLTVPWQSYLFILYTASALIMVRSVFRIAEYVMGQDGFLLRHEYFLYIFDAALMFMSMILFNVWHPSKIIANHHLSKHSRDPESQESSYEITEHSVCASRKP